MKEVGGVERIPEQSPGERLYEVYKRLRDTVIDSEGFGGPVSHIARVGDWDLRIATSDFGDLMAGMSNSATKQYRYFEHFANGEWVPTTVNARLEHLDELADFAEQAEWHDELERDKASQE